MIIHKRTFCFLAASTLLLAACDLPFMNDDEAKIEAKRQAEGNAVGGGCRYSSRALEECYGLNPKMSKAAILSGWRDMDSYMRENNILVSSPEAADAAAKKSAEAKPDAAESTPAQSPAKAAAAAPAANAAAPVEAPAKGGVPMRKRPKHFA